MRKKPRIRRLVRWSFHALIMLVSLTVVMSLVTPTVPARAATSAGDVTFTFDSGPDPNIKVTASELQQGINQIERSGGRLSDKIKRMVEEYTPALPSSLGATQYEGVGQWVSFDGTLSVTSDGTGVSLTIPASEAQAYTASNWLDIVASIAYAFTWITVRVSCSTLLTVQYPAAPVLVQMVCAYMGGFLASIVRSAILAGPSNALPDPLTWATAIVSGIISSIPSAAWEGGINNWAVGVSPGLPRGSMGMPKLLRGIGSWFGRALSGLAGVSSTTDQRSQSIGSFPASIADNLPVAVAAVSPPSTPSGQSCDAYAFYGTPCVAAYTTVHAMYATYDGPLYQVQRASDGATADIGLLSAGGYADANAQDSFCAGTSCTITKIYDQSPSMNDLTVEGAGGAAGADGPASATALPITVHGHKAYGIDFTGRIGYRDNNAQNTATNGAPEGMYMVASGTNVNSSCCFDFGNAETNTRDTGNGHMDAVNFSTTCSFAPCTGSGPWVEADLENGLFQGGNGSNTANTGLVGNNFVTAMLKNNGQSTYALEGGNAQSGGLTTWYNGSLPTIGGYKPMQQEGAIVLGTGGDNSNRGVGSFFEGAMTTGFPSNDADNTVQSDIVATGYVGNSGGSGSSAGTSSAGPALVHSGYTSVYTVDAANGHLQETYLPAMGDPWTTQDLTAKYGTPQVMPGTQPVALVHSGYTSVYTVDAANGHLQETFLPAMGDPWTTQDLTAKYGTPQVLAGTSPVAIVHTGYTSVYTIDASHDLQETFLPAMGDPWTTQDLTAKYGTPPTSVTPTALVHDGYTSVYTVDDSGSHLQETFLPAMGDPWTTQDLTAKYGTPAVAPGTQPVALFHSGYSSVYTVDKGSDHVQETYLANIGAPWASQDFTAKYGTSVTDQTPSALLHPDAGGNLTWTSVYTIGEFNEHLQETYLPAIGDPWTMQDLSAKYGAPPVEETEFPTANWSVIHAAGATGAAASGYTSVYTIDASNGHLQETYLTAIGQPWATQDLSAHFGTPPVMAHVVPVAVTHAAGATGAAASGYTSVYTIDASNGHLQETYLTAIGQPWATQDLSAHFGTPASKTTPTAVFHDGYTSVYTIDSTNGHLWETYLPAMGDPWHSQDLTANYGVPVVDAFTSPVAVFHSGWTSVYTIDKSNEHLQETFLPAIGDPWTTQDLSAKYGTPPV